MSFESFLRWSAPVLFMACGLATFLAGRRFRGSTFVGPWYWALAVFVVASAGTLLMGIAAAKGAEPSDTLSFILATFFFCPVVSVLGAKRPQHNAWHLIVVSLWLVLILPAAETALIRRNGSIQIHDARAWFLWALIAVAFLNYVFTRYVLSVTLSCTALIIWLSPYLPGLRWQSPDRIGWAAILLSIATAAYFRSLHQRPTAGHPLDESWIDFRDRYGVTWGLRVMERVNTAATAVDASARLEWDGFKVAETITDEQTSALHTSYVGILRRFLSEEELSMLPEVRDSPKVDT